MTVDMSQFLETFYEESFEGLDIMESSLLNLDVGAADDEVINNIFRAAHSIKGGSGTFGLDAVASFTHVLETLLDEMRDGRRQVTGEAVNLLLQSVDCLRGMLTALRGESDLDQVHIDEIHDALEAMLHAGSGAVTSSVEIKDSVSSSASTTGGWQIYFRPLSHMLQSGNDPVRMLKELTELGELTVEVDTSVLPPFAEIIPEESYLAWNMTLKGSASRELVDEVFAWVDGDCELEINPIEEKAALAEAVEKNADSVRGELLNDRRGERSDRRKNDRRGSASATGEATSIRVGIDKVDSVINLVGELVITQSMLGTLGEDFDMSKIQQLADGLSQLERNTRELQEQVMRMRMLPISFTFSRFPRMVHDISEKLGKKIELKLLGEQTELDKTVIEKIGDPLVHLVRNSLDHGIETPAARRAAGKSETGTLLLNAFHRGGNIVIEVTDDGNGLNTARILSKAIERGLVSPDANMSDEDIHALIFLPGFSTADVVTDVSGRGVGMDVVRSNIRSLGGSVSVVSKPGVGSTFTVKLPLTLAILDGQTVSVGDEVYIVPLVSIIESMQVKAEMLNYVAGKGEVFRLRNEYLPIIRLHEAFTVKSKVTEITEGLLVVVEAEGKRVGLFVDELLGQQQVVIKSLEENYRKVEGISGATILGDGSVALIMDIPGLIRLSSMEPDLRQSA